MGNQCSGRESSGGLRSSNGHELKQSLWQAASRYGSPCWTSRRCRKARRPRRRWRTRLTWRSMWSGWATTATGCRSTMRWTCWHARRRRWCWRALARRRHGSASAPAASCCRITARTRWLRSFARYMRLYPGRVDLGVGRAPGGGPLEAHALRRERRQRPADDFEDQLAELLCFSIDDFPAEHPFSQLTVSPEMPGRPEVWLLGSSMWSAEAAAQFGLPYSFAHFFSPVHTRAAIEHYTESFRASRCSPADTQECGGGRAVRRDGRGGGADDGESATPYAAHSQRGSSAGAAT